MEGLESTLVFDITMILQVVLIDLALGGDNSIVIGMAAKNLPKHLQKRAILYGTAGAICGMLGIKAPNFLGQPSAFKHLYVWSDVWQHVGWDSIIYIAALSSVDPSLYEAATVDGATNLQKIKYVDIPMLVPTAVIMLIMRFGSLMSLGFEKVYLMQNDLNLTASEVISTYVYKIGIINVQYSYSAAINLFSTVINFILLILVNQISKKVSDNSLW